MASIIKGYEQKAEDYFEQPRTELLRFVPEGANMVLDVGCGAGRFGQMLREKLHCVVWGVEPDPRAAARAQGVLDRVIVEMFSSEVELPAAAFDLICFNDVLEHMANPELALRYARTLLKPSGYIIASVPNFRQFNNIWKLVVRGHATYKKWGIMDNTHLRIFTFNSIQLLFEDSAYVVSSVVGITPQYTHWLFHVFNALSLGAVCDMRWTQIVVVARPATFA